MPVMFAILSFSFRPSTPGWMMRLAHATSSTSGRWEEEEEEKEEEEEGEGRGGEGREAVAIQSNIAMA